MNELWNKEDTENFNRSEVFVELEKRVLANIERADSLYKKIAQESISQKTKDVESLGKAVENVNKQVAELGSNLADDQVSDDDPEDDLQDEIVEDLMSMAKIAVDKGDYNLAYKIERAIDEILEVKVPCE
jgi:hypothetical protein